MNGKIVWLQLDTYVAEKVNGCEIVVTGSEKNKIGYYVEVTASDGELVGQSETQMTLEEAKRWGVDLALASQTEETEADEIPF